MFIELAVDHFVRGAHDEIGFVFGKDAEGEIHQRGCLLDDAEGADHFARNAFPSDAEEMQRTRGLRVRSNCSPELPWEPMVSVSIRLTAGEGGGAAGIAFVSSPEQADALPRYRVPAFVRAAPQGGFPGAACALGPLRYSRPLLAAEVPMARTVKAIGLISGGLDSTLATALVKEQGIEVEALNFSTGFCFSDHHRAMKSPKHRLRQEALRAGSDLEMPVTIIDIADEYFEEVLLAPRHGYGANMNPCLDCRAYMLSRAREYMEKAGADFVFTGEVLGQRPKSQFRRAMDTSRGSRGWTTGCCVRCPRSCFRPLAPSAKGGSIASCFSEFPDAAAASKSPKRKDADSIRNKFPSPPADVASSPTRPTRASSATSSIIKRNRSAMRKRSCS